MASPIGHTLAGLAVGRALGRKLPVFTWRWYALWIVAANAPDFDLLPGLVVGDINRFHHGVSHSMGAAVFFSVAAILAVLPFNRRKALWAGFTGGAAYASHLLVDLLTVDGRAPFGIPLYWPVSSEYVAPLFNLFSGVSHGVPGDSLLTFMLEFFSLRNLLVVGLEAAVLGPLVALAWFISKRRRRAAESTSEAETFYSGGFGR